MPGFLDLAHTSYTTVAPIGVLESILLDAQHKASLMTAPPSATMRTAWKARMEGHRG